MRAIMAVHLVLRLVRQLYDFREALRCKELQLGVFALPEERPTAAYYDGMDREVEDVEQALS